MKLVRRKKIDLIMAHKLDRLGRSLPHLAQMIGEFEANGVALFIPGQGIDTRQANPAGRLQMHILMAVADFERALISERTKLKLRALQAAGKHVGRPKMLKSVEKRAQAICDQAMAETGKLPTCQTLATELNMSVGAAHALRDKFRKQPLAEALCPPVAGDPAFSSPGGFAPVHKICSHLSPPPPLDPLLFCDPCNER